MLEVEKYPHSYPHCWRCKTELLFRLVDEWFIAMSWRDEIKAVVEQGRWLPEAINGKARELDWLDQHGRLDDLQEALLGPRPADLGGRGHRRLRGDRLARGAETARRRGLADVRGPHAAPALGGSGQDPQPEDRQPHVAHPRRGQSVAGRGHRAVLDHEVQHGSRILEKVVPGRLRDGGVPRPVPQLVLRHAGDEHDDGGAVAVPDAAGPRRWCATSAARRCTSRRATPSRSTRRHGYEIRNKKGELEKHPPMGGPDPLDVLPAQPGEQHQFRLPSPPTSCAASSRSSCGTPTPSSATTPGRRRAASTCPRRPCPSRSAPTSTAGFCRICKS